MNQDQFIQAHEQKWLILEALIDPRFNPENIRKRRQKKNKKAYVRMDDMAHEDKILAIKPELFKKVDFPGLYREVCHHLSLSQARRYSPDLIERLSLLVEQAHQKFYRHSHVHGESATGALISFFTRTFPQTVRQESRYVWLSSGFFYLPLFLMVVIIQIWPEFVYSILDPDTVASMERMYDPQASHIGRERGSDSDSLMFGYYIFNNTSIGFRTFATGLIFGIGSIFTLAFNGFFIGAIAGHLTGIGYGTTFWSFVSGHSALELTAIALSGAAGLKLGLAILIPGRKSRYQSMVDAARISVRIMAGAAVMFFMAAFIEAYWSSTQAIVPTVKYFIGIGLWILVFLYFALVGNEYIETGVAIDKNKKDEQV
jgi:uncharacterized membrane protein SpoIIM required for sporulation